MLARVPVRRKKANKATQKTKVKVVATPPKPFQQVVEEYHDPLPNYDEAQSMETDDVSSEFDTNPEQDEIKVIMEDTMTLKELLQIQDTVARRIEQHRTKLLTEIQALAQYGFNIFNPPTRRKRRYSTGKVYVNPDDPSKTWGGFGRRPHWIQERLDRGEDIEQLVRR